MSYQCFWCGSNQTHFSHYECWEEDEIGNQIEVSTLETEYTPRDEVWWCDNCDGAFAWPVDYEESENENNG